MSRCFCGMPASVDWFEVQECGRCALRNSGTQPARHYWVLYGGTYEPVEVPEYVGILAGMLA